MKHEILTFPHKLLKKESVPVEKVTSKITEFVNDLFETMYASATGIGLAAPQVGENLNILVMDINRPDPEDPEKRKPNPICLINPKIIRHEGVIIFEEGCLSCPDLLVEVERAQSILVEALDASGHPIELELTNLESVCAQHEMDHLKGKLLTDHISRLKREMYRKQRVRMKAEKDKNKSSETDLKI